MENEFQAIPAQADRRAAAVSCPASSDLSEIHPSGMHISISAEDRRCWLAEARRHDRAQPEEPRRPVAGRGAVLRRQLRADVMDAVTPAPALERPQRHEDVFAEDRREAIYTFLHRAGLGNRLEIQPGARRLHVPAQAFRRLARQRQAVLRLPGGAEDQCAAHLQGVARRARQDLRRPHPGPLLRQWHVLWHGRLCSSRRQRCWELHGCVLPARSMVAELGRRDDLLQRQGEPRCRMHVSKTE